jgi:hypothetical protein
VRESCCSLTLSCGDSARKLILSNLSGRHRRMYSKR